MNQYRPYQNIIGFFKDDKKVGILILSLAFFFNSCSMPRVVDQIASKGLVGHWISQEKSLKQNSQSHSELIINSQGEFKLRTYNNSSWAFRDDTLKEYMGSIRELADNFILLKNSKLNAFQVMTWPGLMDGSTVMVLDNTVYIKTANPLN